MIAEPKISIIVPVYKVEQYLDECVQSIIHQTYTNLEIILVDDGSPDRCPEMCDEYARRDSRITVIHKKNGGLSSARNAGLEIATGEYIGFVDSDDWIAPKMYQKMLTAFYENFDKNIGIVSCQVYQVKEKITVKFAENLAVSSPNIISFNDFAKELLYDNITDMVWNKLYKADIVKGIRFKEGRNNEDTLFNYQVSYCLAEKESNLFIIPGWLYHYRYNETGIKYSKKTPVYLDVLKNDSFYIDDSRKRSAVVHTIACRRFVRDVFSFYTLFADYKPWNKYLPEINRLKKQHSGLYAYIKDKIGIRHKCQYFIIWYLPYLWKFQIVRDFCQKKGECLPIQ